MARSDLPEMCYAKHPVTGEAVLILRGERGYHTTQWRGSMVDAMNAELGVTVEQREAMIVGSMFGWHVPGADPATHLNRSIN